ncbi:MAG: amidohydrolase family protein, partial [Spirochaetaceae bacterium]|nr:amidohydrolase family protein [Spirochaetaceae bacterium]
LTGAFTGVCAELGMPVLVHANEPVGHQYPGKTDTTLCQLELFVEHSPDNDIILAHWGGGLLYFETMPELRKKFARVFYDCAASPFLYDSSVYRIACELGLETKILFGSDYPLLPITRYIPEIEASGIPDRAKALLLGENCRRILGI